jgi:hypothetical protein
MEWLSNVRHSQREATERQAAIVERPEIVTERPEMVRQVPRMVRAQKQTQSRSRGVGI